MRVLQGVSWTSDCRTHSNVWACERLGPPLWVVFVGENFYQLLEGPGLCSQPCGEAMAAPLSDQKSSLILDTLMGCSLSPQTQVQNEIHGNDKLIVET